jgi:hypothetical protein
MTLQFHTRPMCRIYRQCRPAIYKLEPATLLGYSFINNIDQPQKVNKEFVPNVIDFGINLITEVSTIRIYNIHSTFQNLVSERQVGPLLDSV